MEKPKSNWASVGQLVLALFGIVIQMSSAILMLVIGITQQVSAQNSINPFLGFMPGFSMAVIGILMVPSAYYALMRILGKKSIDFMGVVEQLRPALWIIVLPPVLAAGYFITESSGFSLFLLPPLHVLAIAIPLFWMIYLAIRKLPTGSSQRIWGVFNAGIFIAPGLIIILELVAGLFLIIIASIYIIANPEMGEKLRGLMGELGKLGSQDQMLKTLGPLLTNPFVISIILAFTAFMVPLIEELFKPIGVWLLFGRKISPAAGFVAGAISGGGYGLVESLLFNVNNQSWMTLVLARNGTAAIHLLTSAMMGWALVQLWQKKRVFRLLFVYVCAVIVHGTWNGLTVIYSLQAVANMYNLPIHLPAFKSLASIAPYILGLIAVGCFLGLILVNRVLMKGLVNRTTSSDVLIQMDEGVS